MALKVREGGEEAVKNLAPFKYSPPPLRGGQLVTVLLGLERRAGSFDCCIDAWVNAGDASRRAYEYQWEPVEFLFGGLAWQTGVHPVRI